MASTTFLIQFFSSLVAGPVGLWPGPDVPGLNDGHDRMPAALASINVNLSSGLAVGTFVTALATNESTGDTSAFSNAIAAQAASVAFSAAGYTVASTARDGHHRGRCGPAI